MEQQSSPPNIQKIPPIPQKVALRKYQPIWEEIKAKKFARIAASRKDHRRIIKAVMKEKDIDHGYKLELIEEHKRSKLSWIQNASIIEFRLKVYLTVNGV